MVEKDRKNGFLYTAACSAARMPPVYPAAAAAVFVLVFFRPEAFAVFPAAVLCVLFLSLCLVSAVCGGKNTRARFWQRVFCIPLCAGFAVGTLALFRIHLYALPPVSLAPPGHVERVLVRLRSDPVPWGESLFRAEGEALTFFAGGTEFPAEGRIALLIPPEIAKSALPGNTAAGHTRIPLALGSTLLCTGKFSASSFNGNSGGGDGFRGEPVRFVVSSVARQEAGNTFLAAVFRGRASLRLAMMKQIYAWGESGGFFLALASGMREFLDAGVNEMFRRAGYVTGAFGKWGLGYPGSEGDPLNQGFDRFVGYNCQRQAHRYYPDHLWRDRERIELPENRDGACRRNRGGVCRGAP